MAIEQLDCFFQELTKYVLKVKQFIINHVVKAGGSNILSTKARGQKKCIELIYDRYSDLQIVELPMFPYELKGMDRLKEVKGILFH